MINIKPLASGSSGNCYHVSDGETDLLLDAGISARDIAKRIGFTLSSVSGVLVTHRHRDHCRAVPELIGAGIDIYALGDVFESLKVHGHRCKRIENCVEGGKTVRGYRIGSFRIFAFDVSHDVPNLGFYLHSDKTDENILYFTDTYYIKQRFPNIDYLMCECNYDSEILNRNVADKRLPQDFKKRLVKSHMSIDTLLEFLTKNDLDRVKRIYLMHLSDNNSDADEFKRRVQERTGCEVTVC